MKEKLQSLVNLSDAQYQELLAIAQKKTLRKKEQIILPNQQVTKIWFIESGLLRAYRLIDGNEITHHFYASQWFATDYNNFLNDAKSDLYLQALTDAEVYEFNKSDLIQLYASHPKFGALGRIIAEKAYLIMVERMTLLQTQSLSERYQQLLQKYPELFQQVAQKQIASYLGVSEQSLSRIKSTYKAKS